MRHFHNDDIQTALSNFSLTYAKVMLVFVVVLFAILLPQKKATDEGIKPKIEYLVTADWPPGDNDVDIWVQAPNGNIMYYGNKDAGGLTLERDDLGNRNNTYMVNGRQVISPDAHQEQVSIRGKEPGEYIVNVHLYRAGGVGTTSGADAQPISVIVKVTKMNPKVEEVFKTLVTLAKVKQEISVVRFTLDENSNFTGFRTDIPISLIYERERKSMKGQTK